MYFTSNDKSDCCGCGTCSALCKQNAILMTEDACGFRYPTIQTDLCVSCGLCASACIFKEKIADSSYESKYYAVRSKDDDVVKASSSGGMLTLLAEYIFSLGGVVYGVVYGEGFRVEHRRAENMEEAKAFRTSKYVQSDTSRLFISVKEDLLAGKPVLVTGTPCQIAGLKEYVSRTRTNTDNLYTCDNICHGVSSPLTFSDYLTFLNKYIHEGDRISYFNMRHKDGKHSGAVLEVKTEQNGSLAEVRDFSYYRLYFNRIATRPSCFACKFTSYSRSGDLSVGDFWNGKKTDFDFDITHGVNEVLVNTDKGQALLHAACGDAYYREVSKEKAWQPHLEYATQKPKNYDTFWTEYLSSDDREQVMRKYLKPSPLFKIINKVTPVLRKTGLYTLFGRLYKTVFVRNKHH